MVIIEVPGFKRHLTPLEFSTQMTLVGKRFQNVGWIVMLVLLATGVTNIMTEESVANMMRNESYIMSLTIKLILFTLMLTNGLIHTMFLGPKMATLAEKMKDNDNEETASEYANLRKRSIFSSSFSLLLSLIIVYFGLIASKA